MTECIQQTAAFQDLGSRKVEAAFKGGNPCADGGLLLRSEVDERTGVIDLLATSFRVCRVASLHPDVYV